MFLTQYFLSFRRNFSVKTLKFPETLSTLSRSEVRFGFWQFQVKSFQIKIKEFQEKSEAISSKVSSSNVILHLSQAHYFPFPFSQNHKSLMIWCISWMFLYCPHLIHITISDCQLDHSSTIDQNLCICLEVPKEAAKTSLSLTV